MVTTRRFPGVKAIAYASSIAPLFILIPLLQSCGRGDFDRELGNGFWFSYTSSIGMQIDKNGEVIVDTAVIDYEFDDR